MSLLVLLATIGLITAKRPPFLLEQFCRNNEPPARGRIAGRKCEMQITRIKTGSCGMGAMFGAVVSVDHMGVLCDAYQHSGFMNIVASCDKEDARKVWIKEVWEQTAALEYARS